LLRILSSSPKLSSLGLTSVSVPTVRARPKTMFERSSMSFFSSTLYRGWRIRISFGLERRYLIALFYRDSFDVRAGDTFFNHHGLVGIDATGRA
jgi:hypothetical protein